MLRQTLVGFGRRLKPRTWKVGRLRVDGVTRCDATVPASKTASISSFARVFEGFNNCTPRDALANVLDRSGTIGIEARFATKKSGGSTKNGRDSIGKRLGVKRFSGERVKPGMILVRQRGNTFHAGERVYMGSDYTLHAKVEGRVLFSRNWRPRKSRKYVNVVTEEEYEQHLLRCAVERSKSREGWEGQVDKLEAKQAAAALYVEEALARGVQMPPADAKIYKRQ